MYDAEQMNLNPIDINLKAVRKVLDAELPSMGRLLGGRQILEPRVCGVYFLWRGSKLRYIGKSTNVHSRVLQHVNSEKKWDAVTVLACDEDTYAVIEEYYIRKYQPPDNREFTRRDHRLGKKAEPAIANDAAEDPAPIVDVTLADFQDLQPIVGRVQAPPGMFKRLREAQKVRKQKNGAHEGPSA